MRGISKPALLVACFAPAAPADDGSAHAYLNSLWQTCRSLGMTSGLPGLPLPPPELPPLPGHSGELEILASATRGAGAAGSGQEVYSVFVFAEHDTVGLIALLAPNDSPSTLARWDDLLAEWATALAAVPGPGAPPPGILGEFRLFEALHRRGLGSSEQTMCERIRQYAPAPPGLPAAAADPWWRGFDRTEHGFRVWRREEDPAREIVSHLYVLASAPLEDELDGWAWAVDGESGLRPLTRYLLHASKARFEARQYAASGPVLGTVEVSDRHTRELLQELEPAASGRALALGRVLRAAALLDRTQLGAQGMTWTLTGLRQLSRTVAIAASNMRIHAPVVRRVGPGTSWPAADLAAAEALIAQADSDQVYLETTRERAEAARALASTIVGREMDDRRGRLTLIQTSVLGALVTALAAVQSLTYTVPVSHVVQSPSIALVTALALFLPLTVLRWAGVRASSAYGWVLACAAGLVGASLGWLVAVLVRRQLDLGPLPVALTLPCAAVSGLITYGASRWLTRRH